MNMSFSKARIHSPLKLYLRTSVIVSKKNEERFVVFFWEIENIDLLSENVRPTLQTNSCSLCSTLAEKEGNRLGFVRRYTTGYVV